MIHRLYFEYNSNFVWNSQIVFFHKSHFNGTDFHFLSKKITINIKIGTIHRNLFSNTYERITKINRIRYHCCRFHIYNHHCFSPDTSKAVKQQQMSDIMKLNECLALQFHTRFFLYAHLLTPHTLDSCDNYYFCFDPFDNLIIDHYDNLSIILFHQIYSTNLTVYT